MSKPTVLLCCLLFATSCQSSSESSSEPWTFGDDASVDATRSDASDAAQPRVHRNVCGLEEPDDRGWINTGDGVWRRDFPAFQDGCGRYQLSVQFELSQQVPDVVLDYQVCNTCNEERVLDVGHEKSGGPGFELEHVDQPRQPFVAPVLWDGRDRQYPIPCEEYAFMSIDHRVRYLGIVRRSHLAAHEGLSSVDRYYIMRFAMRQSTEDVGLGGDYEPIDVEDWELRLQVYWASLKPVGALPEEASTFNFPAFCERAGIPSQIGYYDVDFETFPLQEVGTVDLPGAYHELWE